MHLADFSVGSLGESGIVGSAMPTAVGAALGSKLQGNDRVVVCFFGDGAANSGPFHETLNLAKIWTLPVIFLCENNLYAITAASRDMMAVNNVADRAVAYDMPGVIVDGQDAVAVFETVSQAVARARAGEGPSLIEAKTYRYQEHSVGLGRMLRAPYRTGDEMEAWQLRDPIDIHRERLLGERVATAAELQAIEDEVQQAVADALDFARRSPFPDPSELYDDMYAVPIPAD
jgi:pyruvate dehydrogenase E1 component alpha subunit